MEPIYDHDDFGGPHFDGSLFDASGRLARLHKGNSDKSKFRGAMMTALEKKKTAQAAPARAEKPAKFEFPAMPAFEIPPAPAPAPNQTVTTDVGQAEDDARVSALRRRGLASGSTIFAGPGGYKPKALGAASGYGSATLGGNTAQA